MARRTRPFLLLLLAVVTGGVAAAVALRYLQRQATPLMATEPAKAQVVVAARALPLGALVAERDVKTLEWSGGAVPVGYFAAPKEVVGRGLLGPVQENEPILASKLAAQGMGGGLPVIIDEGMRAITIPVDQVVGVAGWVLPTTRVDVLLTLSNNEAKEPAIKAIMQNVRTLAAGHSIQQDREGKPVEVSVVTFLVSPEQAETLALASQQGRIQLTLRNMLDTSHVQTAGTRVSALMGRLPGRRAPARSGPVRANVPAPAPSPTTVEVYRGGQRTLMKFGQ